MIAGSIGLGDVSKMVGKERLTAMKSEFGGLQTLLRNEWQIFKGNFCDSSLRLFIVTHSVKQPLLSVNFIIGPVTVHDAAVRFRRWDLNEGVEGMKFVNRVFP